MLTILRAAGGRETAACCILILRLAELISASEFFSRSMVLASASSLRIQDENASRGWSQTEESETTTVMRGAGN
jgi:hypothetical protein